ALCRVVVLAASSRMALPGARRDLPATRPACTWPSCVMRRRNGKSRRPSVVTV
ncbi:unnamed protein product, partial [Amoebophrya sp. A120]